MSKLYKNGGCRRVLALLLVFMMVFSSMQTSGFAVFAESETTENSVEFAEAAEGNVDGLLAGEGSDAEQATDPLVPGTADDSTNNEISENPTSEAQDPTGAEDDFVVPETQNEDSTQNEEVSDQPADADTTGTPDDAENPADPANSDPESLIDATKPAIDAEKNFLTSICILFC